jgi:hypothetical protein
MNEIKLKAGRRAGNISDKPQINKVTNWQPYL